MLAAPAAGVALAVSPARTVMHAPAARTVQVSNTGRGTVAVDIAWTPLGQRRLPAGWLQISPGHLLLQRGARAFLTVRAGAGASPGDHNLLILVTAHPTDRVKVGVQLRLGVRVRIRAPGQLVHRLVLGGLRARELRRRRALLVSIANRGNVTEQLRGRLSLTLSAHDRVLSRLRLVRFRELYPGTRGIVALPYTGAVHGRVTAIVTVRLGAGVRSLERRYRLRL
jgi:hypothetical protein